MRIKGNKHAVLTCVLRLVNELSQNSTVPRVNPIIRA
jgi:hypothetical protein